MHLLKQFKITVFNVFLEKFVKNKIGLKGLKRNNNNQCGK